MMQVNEAAKASFANGDADLANAYLITNSHGSEDLYGIACFHCHQAVEKYLKGFLLLNDQDPPRIHDLKLLLDECIKFDNSFKQFDRNCRDLNPCYIETRYEPSAPKDFDADEARDAYQKAEKVVEAIKRLIEK